MEPILYGRQTVNNGSRNGNGDEFFYDRDSFWYTRTGQIVRWSIFFGLFFLFLAYMAIGRWHANKRIKAGLEPLGYHRWLLNREQRAMYDPNYQNPQVFYNSYGNGGGQYNMHPMPPPMYDPNAPLPPTYQPPMGGTKVDPSQWRSEPTRRPGQTQAQAPAEPSPDYDAPPGPPPAAQTSYNAPSGPPPAQASYSAPTPAPAPVQPTYTGSSNYTNNPFMAPSEAPAAEILEAQETGVTTASKRSSTHKPPIQSRLDAFASNRK